MLRAEFEGKLPRILLVVPGRIVAELPVGASDQAQREEVDEAHHP
jgi:hypothetical protein